MIWAWALGGAAFISTATGIYIIHADISSMVATLDAHAATVATYIAAYPILSRLCYILLYVTDNVCALPIAAVLTISAGHFFGFWQSIGLTFFAVTMGSFISYSAARQLARPLLHIEQERVAWLRRFFSSYGIYGLIAIRIIPFMPFSAINMAAGIIEIRRDIFLASTAFGMLPTITFYSFLGTILPMLAAYRSDHAGTISAILILLALLVTALGYLHFRLVHSTKNTTS